jgi:hypothetical protein
MYSRRLLVVNAPHRGQQCKAIGMTSAPIFAASPLQSPAWAALQALSGEMAESTIRSLMDSDPSRAERMTLTACGLDLDFSRQRINDEVLSTLRALAEQRGVFAARDSMLVGGQLNNTENRAFRELFQGQYDEGTFPSTGFCVQQDEYFSWMHVVRGDKESLTSYYDFVEVADE